MSDPRNVAHDKKVTQEKHAGQPGKKTAAATQKADPASTGATAVTDASSEAVASGAAAHPALAGSLVVLAQLKDLDFHSRAHLQRLATLQMTIEDELKQERVVEPLAEVYAAQNAFQDKLTVLIEAYKAECDQMQAGAS